MQSWTWFHLQHIKHIIITQWRPEEVSNITKTQLRGYKKSYCSSVGWTQVCFISDSHSSSLHRWHAASCTGTKPWIWALITRSRTIRYGCNSQGDGAAWQPSDQSCSIIHFSAVDASWSDFSRKLLGAPLRAKSSCTPWFLHISRSSVGQNQSGPPATDDCEKPNWALRYSQFLPSVYGADDERLWNSPQSV